MAKATKKSTKKAAKKTKRKAVRKFEKRAVEKSFWFKLTDKERQHHADEAFRLKTEQIKKEMQFADVKKMWASQIKELETQFDEHRQIYQAKREWREVSCVEVKDFQKLEVRYMIGKEIKETRKMDDREKQMALQVRGKPIDGGNGSSKRTVADVKKCSEIRDVLKQETNKNTKTSAVDAKSKKIQTNSSAYADLHGQEPVQ